MILNINRDGRLIVEESKLDEKLSRKKIIVSHDSKEIQLTITHQNGCETLPSHKTK